MRSRIEKEENLKNLHSSGNIAVIGMAGRFPMAANLEEFWENLKNGKDCVGGVPGSRLRDWRPLFGDKLKDLPEFGYLEKISTFDARFFGIPPAEAPLIDPSHRLLLEIVYEAFEYGGYGGTRMANTRTGVFIACADSNYKCLISLNDYSKVAETGNLPEVSAGRISHTFDLRGPSLLIDTGCSSSLAALHYACESIRRSECSMAVVGAVEICAYREWKAARGTPSKRCNVFDNSADGMVNGEGAGALLLKPLRQALKDGDVICAVIRGEAINHNGGRTPTVSGQKPEALAEVIEQALENAGVTPDTLSYIEASGASNTMGDLFEIKGISNVFAKYTAKKQFCPIGSVKTNVGHLNHASGLASLIKVILALKYKQIPPLVHYKEPNALIDFKDSPVYIDTRLKEWKTEANGARRAGISSFSVSGTNCHVIVEEAPPIRDSPASYRERYHLLTVSAKTETSLKKLCQTLKESIRSHPHRDINDICYTQNTGRGQYEYRLALICKDKDQLIERLNAPEAMDKDTLKPGTFRAAGVIQANIEESGAVFLLSHCSEQDTYRDFFNKGFLAGKYMDECNAIFPLEKYPRVRYFAFQYALAGLWMDAGIKPTFMLGVGNGKYVSKVISGTMKLEEALNICNAETSEKNTFYKDKFIQTINQLYSKKGQRIFLEIGFENMLGRVTRETLAKYTDFFVLNSYGREDKERTLLEAIALLYTGGIPIDFSALFPGKKLVLPVYPFDGKRYWVKSHPHLPDIETVSAGTVGRDQTQETVPGSFDPRAELSTRYTAPRSEVEHTLAAIFQEFFGIEKVGIYDDFFQLGGDSLKATNMIAIIHKEFNVKVPLTEIFEIPTIRGLSQYIKDAKEETFASIEPVEKKEYYALSPAQQRLFILHRMDLNSVSYNLPQVISFSELIDVERMQSAFKKLTQRHESLRTSFEMVGEEPVQRVHEEVNFAVEVYEADEVETEEIIDRFTRPFDLSRAPLLRAGLIKLKSSRCILLTDMHHIITDGTSNVLLKNEFNLLYPGKAEDLPLLRLQYKDYARWQNSEIQQALIKEQETYWLKMFPEEVPVLDLPTDYPRPLMQSFEGCTVEFLLTLKESKTLKTLAKDTDVTLYMSVLSVFTILLSKLSGQEDIVIGTALAARRHADLEKIIGMFVNTLALRNKPAGGKVLKEFVKELKERTLEAYENQEYPFEQLVDKTAVKRDTGRNPVFDVMYNFMNLEEYTADGIKRIDEKHSHPYKHRKGTSKFDLTLTATDLGERVSFAFEYCTKLFKPGTIERFISYFKNILDLLSKDSERKLSKIDIITEVEKHQVLYEFNDTGTGFPVDKTIHGLFAEQVYRAPDSIALGGPSPGTIHRSPLQMTYGELNERSNRCAYVLQGEGVEPGDILGIMVERSIEMIIGILGILIAGGAYLPIAPGYPRERINYMLKDSGAKILLSGETNTGNMNEALKVIDIKDVIKSKDDISTQITQPAQLCYIIYTSGTTGKPKGVMIEHHSLVNRLNWMQKQYPLDKNDTLLHKTAITFDVSVWELFWWAITGAKVCLLIPGGEKNPEIIAAAIEQNNVTVIHFVPSMLSVFIENLKIGDDIKKLACLRQVIASGEALTVTHVERFKEILYKENSTKLANLYGPTEATIDVTYYDCLQEDNFKSIPIGKPIDNIHSYVLNECLHLQPVGIAGELYIGGIGLARGYLNRPQLTLEKFVKNPFLEGGRLYRSGDLSRWQEDGNIEFLGRIDTQVKIRGFRIELGEIENQLLTHEKVKEAILIAGESADSDKYLCAYIVGHAAKGEETTVIEPSRLREYLSHRVPDYMIPSYFVQLDQIPLTANGKIDRKALPEPGFDIHSTGYAPPRNENEMKLVEIWSVLLGIKKEKIGIHDNFFELGGHSLKATAMMSKIHKETDIKIELAQIFKNSTISGLAQLIEKSNKTRYAQIEMVEKKEYYRLSSAQKRLYFLQIMEETGTAYNMPGVMKLEGKVELEKLENTFRKLIRRHESFRTSFLMVEEEPAQRIYDKVSFKLNKSFVKLFQKRPPGGPPEALIKSFIRPFDLSQAPLLRVGLVEIAKEEHLFMVDMHHIISDGTSMGVLVGEFMTLYEGRELPRLRLHYKDYAEWEAHEKAGIKQQKAFWLSEFGEFADDTPVLDLPLDYLRPKVQDFEGNDLSFQVDSADTAALKTLALQRGATLYMVLLAVYTIFLAKTSSQEVIVVGTPTAGRRHADLEQVIGMFVNTLALKNYPSGEKDLHSFLEEVKEKTLNAFANQDYQYEELVEKAVTDRDTGRNPLFDTMFVLQNQDIPTIENPGLKLATYPYEGRTSKFDLTLVCIESDDHLSCTLEYNTALFKPETSQRFVNYLKKIVSAVLRDPGQQIFRIDMLPEEEKKQLIMDFNDTAEDFPKDKTIYRLFADQVDRFPDHTALVFDDRTVTFRHFDRQANGLARYLRMEKGVQPGDRIAVLMDRSIELIIVLMAAMKARGAYVPMDAALPAERIRIVCNDASIGVAVSQRKYLQKLSGVQTAGKSLHTVLPVEDLENDPDNRSGERLVNGNAQDPAYVMYTSGSSGIPKGVLVEHRTIVNTITWRKNNYEYAPGHVSLQVPPYFFDSSVTDIFTPLLGGARLVLVRDDQRSDLTVLSRIITVNIVSHFIVVPVFYNVMLEEIGADLKHIKMICCAGDNFPDQLIKKHFERLPHVRIFNEYGPTENSVNTTAYELKPHSPKALIGKPISNVKVYVLDRNLSLCPIGVTGQLCLAGSSLAVGYLNRPELTNEKFIIKSFLGFRGDFSKKPLVAEGIVYKTGDQGRWLADGNLEFIGRVDNQVKIRGIRVETGEIENQLMKHDHIKEAVVQVRQDENGTDYLCAYLVPHSHGQLALKPEGLKDYLSLRLPTYMIPSYFQVLEQLPLTPNGKLDVKALPAPQLKSTEEYTTPRNEIEKKLVEIWKAVLGIDHIGINDNFFYIGGDSIKSIQIMSRMNRAGYKLEIKDIFQYPVISELAPHVKKLQRLPDQSPVTGPIPLTPIQAAFFNAPPIDPHHYNQAVMFYSSTGFDKETIEKVFGKIQEHHDALRMTYKINSESGEVRQINHGPDFPLSLLEYDLRDRENSLDELDRKINRIQSGIDLEKGPLMKLGLFHLDDGDRLLIVIHHLVIDGVSWRILFEDIETLYGRYQRGEEPVLPPKTDAFKLWSEKLQEYAHHKNFLKEKPYWIRLESEILPPIKKDFQVEENEVKDTRSVSFSLEEAETALLLNKVNRSYTTEINDILLTALAMAIKKTFGLDRAKSQPVHRVLIALEGHGREKIFEDLDINRTVGWFTTEYPVLMDVSYADDPGRQIKEIKETLRNIPNKGIGCGILKYLTGEAYKKEMDFRLKPQIIFNYLGQFDADVRQISSFKIAKESTGNTQSLRNRREYELEINGMTAGNRLSMTISYNETHFKPRTIAALAGNFQSKLKHIIAFCSAKENIEPTPSDFTYKGLSIERLRQLMDVYPGIEDIYTLSPMQEGMLFHALIDESSNSYFEQTSFRLQGELYIGLVEKSLNQLVKRHGILRTTFVHKDTKRPVQVVLKNRPVDFYYRDISHIIASEEKENFVREFKAKDKKRSFDLSKDILVRASILRLDRWLYEFTWSFHHILMDGWCIGILNSEFFEIYSGYVDNRPYRLPPIKPYRTYIQWLEKQDKEESGRYWENYLDCFEEQTGIPNKKIEKKENHPGYSNKKVSFQLNGDKTKMLNQLAARHHVTLNIVNQTVWGILLGKYNGKEDVVFGSVVSGRPFELAGVESMVGLFINTIPVRIHFHEKMKFHQLLQKVQAEAIAGEPYHYHPLADIQSRSPLKQNLMDHIFVFENYPIAEQIEGYGSERNKTSSLSLQLTDVDVFEQTNYDFNILLAGTDRLKITFQYNANVVDDDDVKGMARHFRLVLNQVMENEELEIAELTLLTPEEKNRLLVEFNDTAVEYPVDKTIHELFEEQVEKTPGSIAVVGPNPKFEIRNSKQIQNSNDQNSKHHLTYWELNRRSNQWAHFLKAKGVQPDTIVGIMVERSIEMVIGILAILKAGGAYLPIDPDYPQEHIDYMLKDSGAKVLVTGVGNRLACSADLDCQLSMHSPMPSPHHSSFIIHHSGNLAYIIYTSGSTGKPKGVMIKHHSVVNILSSLQTQYPLMEADTYLLKTPYIFDVSVAELFGWFPGGGQLVILEQGGEKDPRRILETIAREYITHINFVPSMLNLFVEILNHRNIDQISPLRYIFSAGEALLPELVKQFRTLDTKIILENIYGPTEGTIYACRYSLQDWNGKGSIPIGKPLRNIKLYILDKNDHLQPVGIAGELCIAGEGLASGYLNRPELTAEKFCLSPFTFHLSPLYKTGDLCRRLPDGNIEFLGRIDHQVKIRGFRIELEEIENRLMAHPRIKEAVVIDRNDNGRQYLCAYVTAAPTPGKDIPSLHELKEYLGGKLPDYMIPTYFMKIEKIPLNPNGKVDRKALPQPLEADSYSGGTYKPPETNIQRIIAETWKEVLGREKIGIRDNFFDLGGNSLDFVAVSNKLREKLNKEIPVATLFTHPTIEALVRYLTSVELPGTSTTVPTNFVMLNGSPRSVTNVFFVHEVLGDVGAYMEFCKQLGTRFNCWGVEAEKLKNYAPHNVTIEEISAKYLQQMKSVQPHGPYKLATWSWGGHLGLEMALQLEKMGETLSFLAFFDCSGPDYKINNSLPQFTLETEKDFLRKFFTATGNQAELEKITDIEQLWFRAVEVLTGDSALVEELRQLLIENALALPGYDKLTGEELIQYLNLNRIHTYASAQYIPIGKLHTPLHYFRADQNPGRVESWKDHCHNPNNPVIYHEINGDHHSIFRNKEQIAGFAGLFKEVISRAWDNAAKHK